ncbi:hypothetical protein BDV98DRAFT_563508 [Pterulicium gracile]|uniref:Uncharacterized protein n=1 Tax=Pterulicium gracile TaxID=1884261 RepID=A0A5C3QT86_9AGAR|nr:hypothetical protein BDV98DRAFT_563508 [Pterula gracilis]
MRMRCRWSMLARGPGSASRALPSGRHFTYKKYKQQWWQWRVDHCHRPRCRHKLKFRDHETLWKHVDYPKAQFHPPHPATQKLAR